MFKHPKYYKELRKRNKSDRVISNAEATAASERAPGQGQTRPSSGSSLKRQAIDETVPHCDIEEASSVKPQAFEDTSGKHQAPSSKRQA